MGLFEEYKNHTDKDVRERANNWGVPRQLCQSGAQMLVSQQWKHTLR